MAKTDPDIGDLIDELEAIEDHAEDPEVDERIRDAIGMAIDVQTETGPFGRVIHGYDRADVTEAFLGALLFGIPMFVEGGTQEVGAFFVAYPVSLVGSLVGSVVLTIGILYVADIQDVRVSKPILGIVPRRLAGVVSVAFLTSLAVMTTWGRVDWATPSLAFAQVCVAFVPMVIGAALGDILPGS